MKKSIKEKFLGQTFLIKLEIWKKQIKRVQEEFLANQGEIDKKEDEFQDFINSLGEKYELGNGIFNISESEPYTIELVS